MKINQHRLVALVVGLLTGSGFYANGQMPMATEWPRTFYRDRVTNTIYQPQLESWDYFTLKAISAVAVQPSGTPQPTFGTISLTAKTRVDRTAREVYFEEIQIEKSDFPSAGSLASNYTATLASLLPKEVRSLSLDRLEASLAILQAREKAKAQPLKNDPPTIIFSTRPAMLISIDGPPVYRTVDGTDLERVFNTRALILRDKDGIHYLHLFDGYVTASALGGPWTVAKKTPKDVKRVEKKAVEARATEVAGAGKVKSMLSVKPKS